MKTKSKFSAYILRGSMAALLCMSAILLATSSTSQSSEWYAATPRLSQSSSSSIIPSKIRSPDGTLDDGKILI